MGNVSYRVGRMAEEHEIRKQVEPIPIFNEMYERLVHYLRALDVNLDSNTVTLGPWLEIDRETECFKDHEEANVLARGCYRNPYTIPDPV